MNNNVIRTVCLILGTSLTIVFCSLAAHGFHAYLDSSAPVSDRMISSEK